MRIVTTFWLTSFPLLPLSFLSTAAAKEIPLSDSFDFSIEGIAQGSLRTPNQSPFAGGPPVATNSVNNQPTSAAALRTSFFSLKSALSFQKTFFLKTRVDYFLDSPFQFGLYREKTKAKTFYLRDLYLSFPLPSVEGSLWVGRRTLEFAHVPIFQMQNPFDQIDLQGAGFSNDTLDVALSFSRETVQVSASEKGQTLSPNDGMTQIFSGTADSATVFVAGKFLLPEGRTLRPLAALRIYRASSLAGQGETQVKTISLRQESSSLLGFIFYRPLSGGTEGQSTVWFESLPPPSTAAENLQIQRIFSNNQVERFPQNTLGFADSSFFHFSDQFSLLTGLVLVNESYVLPQAVLFPNKERTSLIPANQETARNTNRLSVAFKPCFSFFSSWQTCLEAGAFYVSKKLLPDDANALIITPIVSYSLGAEKTKGSKIFTSLSFGVYDWRAKALAGDARTNTLITTQTGVLFDF